MSRKIAKRICDPENVIEIRNLKIVFDEKEKKETVVLDNISQKFEKNKIHFIVGSSGSGKTTLITHFNGLLHSKYGDIAIGNYLIEGKQRKIKNFKKIRKTIGMVFQFPEYQLFKDTIEKDVMFGPINLGVKKDEAKIRAIKYLKMIGLDETFLYRSPFGLSGGQKRRVAIAGILAIEPSVLVFDEPTAGLDPAGEREMIEIIKKLKQEGKTVFVITHVMDHVLEIADRVHVLNDKKIEMSGTAYEIFANKELLKKTSMDLPKVIRVIEKLIECDKKYEEIFQYKPKTIEQLADSIVKINGGVK